MSDSDDENDKDDSDDDEEAEDLEAQIVSGETTEPSPPKPTRVEVKSQLKLFKRSKKNTELKHGGRQVMQLYESWKEQLDLKNEYVKEEEYLNAHKQKDKLRYTRYKLVKLIEAKLDAVNLNKTLRRYKDIQNNCVPKIRASEWNGCLNIIAHEADGVKGKDKRTNAYLRFRLGGVGDWKKTKTVKNSTTTPDFTDEKITFDVLDGNKICENNDATLEVEIFDDNFPFDAKLGKCTIKLKKFIIHPLKPITGYHQMHIYKFGEGFIKTASVKLSISFEGGFEGISVFALHDARNLADKGGFGDKQDPYAVIKVGRNRKRSKTIDNGGVNPNFNKEEILIHCLRDCFKDDISVRLWDDDIGRDDVIGSTTFSLLPHIRDCQKVRYFIRCLHSNK